MTSSIGVAALPAVIQLMMHDQLPLIVHAWSAQGQADLILHMHGYLV